MLFALVILSLAYTVRGNEPSVLRGQGEGPRDATGSKPNILARVDLSDSTYLEFHEVKDDIYMIGLASGGDIELLGGLFRENDPIKVFKKLQPDAEVPYMLKEAKDKVDAKIKEVKAHPREYPEVPSHTDNDPVPADAEIAEGGDHHQLCLGSDCPMPDWTWGTQNWWKYNYCAASDADETEWCNCLSYITGNWGDWVRADDMRAHVYVDYGSLGLGTYTWECGWFSCDWEYGSGVRIPMGHVGTVWSYGSDNYRKAGVWDASGDSYHYSIYSLNDYHCMVSVKSLLADYQFK